jgi:hypothetical protein
MSTESKEFPDDRAADRIADQVERLAHAVQLGNYDGIQRLKRQLADELEDAIQASKVETPTTNKDKTT